MDPGADNAARLAEHERLVAALLRDPAALRTPPEARTLVTTAISSLIVAGDEVFKLRKPLVTDFLDFSTQARRRADCEDELRLNRRTATQIYLDVLPIGGSADAPRIADAGAPIDWVLRMRRFDDTQRLDRLSDAGRLDAATIDALALTVARFHAALPPSPAACGRADDVRRFALDNFDVLLAGPAAAPHGARLRALRAWTAAAFERLAPLIEQRRNSGFVREGHGDLHLANIVLIDGAPVPFDALEFNPALRHIDTVADLAFLFMDLVRHGLPALAWRCVNAWADSSGDHAGLALLHFFAVYRAMVRAKVALLRAAQHDGEAWAAFERDLALAETLAAPRTRAPRLLIASGVSGSGKSTLALAVAEAAGAIRLRSDVERKRLFGLDATARVDAAFVPTLYSADANARTYAQLHERAAALLDAGLDAIVDAAFLRRRERDAIRELARAHGATALLVECHAGIELLRERVARRLACNDDASDADLAVLARQLQWREAAADDEAPLRLDTRQDVATLCAQTLAAWSIA